MANKTGKTGGGRGGDKGNGGEKYAWEVVKLKTGLDPALQKDVLKGRVRKSSIAEGEPEGGKPAIDVIAKLRNPNQKVPGLRVVRTIGRIVTGSVDSYRIEEVREHENVISLKRARRLHRTLGFAVPEVNGSPSLIGRALSVGNHGISGSGVIVGVVDHGCDFAHHNFRNGAQTRILYLWDQNGTENSQSPSEYGYGREFDSAEINNALSFGNDPYSVLQYKPADAAHGTHVLDIAAGNGNVTGNQGVAPNADIIFVDVASDDVEEDGSLGNSRRLLEAVDYIFSKARQLGKSAVVNISLGTQGGPHDGSTLVEEGFDTLLRTPGRAIVIAAGNFYGLANHARGEVEPGAETELDWQIKRGDRTDNEMEIWYSGKREFEALLIDPAGNRIGPFALGTTASVESNGREVALVFHRKDDPNNRDNQIDILLRKTDSQAPPQSESGVWKVRLKNVGEASAKFHAWIERDDRGPSRLGGEFVKDDGSIGSIACGEDTIAVGAYEPRSARRNLFIRSSAGRTRDGKQKPEVSAPGDNIQAARALSQGTIRLSGTSMAAPHVTGLIALLMQRAGRPLSIEEIRRAVIDHARNNPNGNQEWDSRYGYGPIDVAASLSSLAAAPSRTNTEALIHLAPSALATTDVEAVVQVAPSALVRVMDGDGHSSISLNDLMAQLVDAVGSAGNSKVRVRLEIEAEP